MNEVGIRRARRWFWTLTAVSIVAMGSLNQGLHSTPSPGTGSLVLVSSSVLWACAVQAARILAVLTVTPKPPQSRRRRRPRHERRGSSVGSR